MYILNYLLILFLLFTCQINTSNNVSTEYDTNINIKTIQNIEDNLEESELVIPRITVDRSPDDVVISYRYNITEKEFLEFVRVVEAEVTGVSPFGASYKDAFESKLRVAQVILNRVESPHFPNTVHDVIFQKNAFTPLVDGRYWEVEISQVTIDACKQALLNSTPDLTNGCEFFSSGTKTCKYGSYIFTDPVGHSFFKSYRTNY